MESVENVGIIDEDRCLQVLCVAHFVAADHNHLIGIDLADFCDGKTVQAGQQFRFRPAGLGFVQQLVGGDIRGIPVPLCQLAP